MSAAALISNRAGETQPFDAEIYSGYLQHLWQAEPRLRSMAMSISLAYPSWWHYG